MRNVDIWPLSRQVPMIGFGCARLTSGIGRRHSAKLVETALDLGIRYFDCAPSYGEGTAESVLGDVIGDNEEVVIATKYGMPRPHYSYRRNLLRFPIRKLFQLAPWLKRRLAKPSNYAMAEWSTEDHELKFDAMKQSLEKSLSLLKRPNVDVFLAHDPSQSELVEATAIEFRRIVESGLAKTFGAGIGTASDNRFNFGQVWQSFWDTGGEYSYPTTQFNIFHGLLKPRVPSTNHVAGGDTENRIREFSVRTSNSIAIVSASTPSRLKEIFAAAKLCS